MFSSTYYINITISSSNIIIIIIIVIVIVIIIIHKGSSAGGLTLGALLNSPAEAALVAAAVLEVCKYTK